MNILIVTQYFWPESFRINDVVKTLVEKDHNVDVLTGKPNYPDGKLFPGYSIFCTSKEEWHGATLYRVPLIPRGKESGARLIINYFSFVFFGTFIGAWLLRKKNYDIIFVYGLSPILSAVPAIFLAKIKKCPTVMWVQDLWPESLEATGYVRNKKILGLVGKLVSWIYKQADLLLVQSHAFVQPVSLMAPENTIKYFPNSVDASFSKPSALDVPYIPGFGSGFSVLFAGNIGTAQSVEYILEAAILLKDEVDINIVVIGSGSRSQWMLEQIEEHDLKNLHLPGRFPIEAMPAFMQKASALLVSLTDKPIFAMTVPNKVQAYLASGRPILAFLNGEGARVVTEAKAGLTVPAEDARGLADAILQLNDMLEEERQKLGDNGRDYYKAHFDHERLIGQLLVHFESTVSTFEESK